MIFNAMLIYNMFDIYVYMRVCVCLKNCYPQKATETVWFQLDTT